MQGDVVIVPPYAAHKAGVAHIENYERIVVNVHPVLLDEFYESDRSLKEKMLTHKQRKSDLLHLNVKQIQSVAALLQPMAKQRNESDAFSFSRQYALFQALRLIFQSAKTNPPVAAPQKQDSRLAEILYFIDQHATDATLSLERVADRVHLNKYYFAHYFKKQMDVSFYRYVSLKRLAFAVSMMKKNDQSIEHIAIQCGFADYSSFYRLFKKEYGQSPKRWQVEGS